MTKPTALRQELFEKIVELVGAEETALDLWNIFDDMMYSFDDKYETYCGDQIGYMFMVFIFGYLQGESELPQLSFDSGDPPDGFH